MESARTPATEEAEEATAARMEAAAVERATAQMEAAVAEAEKVVATAVAMEAAGMVVAKAAAAEVAVAAPEEWAEVAGADDAQAARQWASGGGGQMAEKPPAAVRRTASARESEPRELGSPTGRSSRTWVEKTGRRRGELLYAAPNRTPGTCRPSLKEPPRMNEEHGRNQISAGITSSAMALGETFLSYPPPEVSPPGPDWVAPPRHRSTP